MLVTAAAQQWSVDAATLRADSGKVIDASGKSIAYGDLLEAAAKVTPPTAPKLKDPKDFKYIGKPVKRLDTPIKVNGSAVFGIDVKVPGMLTAVMLRSPVFGGTVKTVDDTAAKAIPGVRAVVPLGYGVGVVADNFWTARKGRNALKVTWDDGKVASVSSESIATTFADAEKNEKGLQAAKVGDTTAAKATATKSIEAIYTTPYLAHATMEPMNATADVRSDGCDVWAGVQGPQIVQGAVAKALGLAPEKVNVHTTLLGGGFGRRIGTDYVMDAVSLSKSVGKPVKVIWTREDDMQNDFYRPSTYNKFSAGIGADGKPVFWHHRTVSSSIMSTLGPILFGSTPKEDQMDGSAVEGANNLPYTIPNFQVDWVHKETGVPSGFWRSVGSSHTAYTTECFLDELAAAAGKDPLEYRLSLLEKSPRHAGVLKLAAEKAGWSTKPAAGVGRGIAVAESFGSYVAQVAEVTVSKEGKVTVSRVVCAVDCGQVVNPNTVMAQMESSIMYGLTAALYGEITINAGRVVQKNFNDYKMVRMNEAPRVEVYIIQSTEKYGGVGEPGTPPIAPAVVNAIFAATGKRVRSLPIRIEELKTN
jgi:isoquinoline 1-oxidoreductase beta subunit